MKVDVAQQGEYLVISLQGRLDTIQADPVEKKMLEILDQGYNRVILDCKQLDYISSSGIRIFLIVQKRLITTGGTLKICNLQPNIQEIFEMSGFSMIFSIHPGIEHALQS